MEKNKFILIIAMCVTILAAFIGLTRTDPVQAQSDTDKQVVIYFFWGDGCPHCAAAKPVLIELAKQNPNVTLLAYEVWNSETNRAYFMDMADAYGFEPSAVPTIFIGDKYWVGYSDVIQEDIDKQVQACLTSQCPDRGIDVIPAEGITAGSAPLPGAETVATAEVIIQSTPVPQATEISPASDEIDLPLVGRIHLAEKSIWLSTALIAFVDGFNPCSLWVLSMLLALTLHTGSRKKVVIIGLIFLTVTAGVYALFIAGLFTMFTVISFVGWIQVVVALVALFFGLVNIKDYFWYKEGLSFTIADEKKPGIYKQMRKLMDASQSFWGLVSGTVVLAAGVSLVEFSCTAGFPVLWTNLLVSQNVTPVVFVLLLLLYLVIYQLDELVIFFTAVYTLKASRVEEKQGRILKLIGGVLMLTMAGVMLINPALMNNLQSSLVIFGIALAATILVLVVHRTILPKFGIHIGTEDTGSTSKRKPAPRKK